MQRVEAVEPRGIGIGEVARGAPIAEHRPLPRHVDQHDDGARTPVAAHHGLDALAREHLDEMDTLWVVADLADEPGPTPGTHHVDRHVRSAAAAPATDDRRRVGRDVDRAPEPYHHVLHQITDGPDHPDDGSEP